MRIVYQIKSQPLDDTKKTLDNLDKIIRKSGDASLAKLKTKALDDLGFTPRKRQYPQDYPIEWTSEKQRKAYFASDGFGKGIPYQRTGKASKSWFVNGVYKDGGFNASIGSSWPKAKYVYGQLSIKDTSTKPMQRFHKITGWQPAREKAILWLTKIQDAFIDDLFSNLEQELKSVKLTRRTRR